jgi:hypothetical protein
MATLLLPSTPVPPTVPTNATSPLAFSIGTPKPRKLTPAPRLGPKPMLVPLAPVRPMVSNSTAPAAFDVQPVAASASAAKAARCDLDVM